MRNEQHKVNDPEQSPRFVLKDTIKTSLAKNSASAATSLVFCWEQRAHFPACYGTATESGRAMSRVKFFVLFSHKLAHLLVAIYCRRKERFVIRAGL